MKLRVSFDHEDRFPRETVVVVMLEAMFSMEVVVDPKRASLVGAMDVRRRAGARAWSSP